MLEQEYQITSVTNNNYYIGEVPLPIKNNAINIKQGKVLAIKLENGDVMYCPPKYMHQLQLRFLRAEKKRMKIAKEKDENFYKRLYDPNTSEYKESELSPNMLFMFVNQRDRCWLKNIIKNSEIYREKHNTVLICESHITENYADNDRKGMKGYNIIEYQHLNGPAMRFVVDPVYWGEDKTIEEGQGGRDYENPTDPGIYRIVSIPQTKKGYFLYVESSEKGIMIHLGRTSEGCTVLGSSNKAVELIKDLAIRIKAGEKLYMELVVIDKRMDKKSRPLPYTISDKVDL